MRIFGLLRGKNEKVSEWVRNPFIRRGGGSGKIWQLHNGKDGWGTKNMTDNAFTILIYWELFHIFHIMNLQIISGQICFVTLVTLQQRDVWGGKNFE